MKRKLVAVIMSLICVFSLSACDSDKKDKDGTTNPTTTGGVVDDAGDIVSDAGDVVEDAGNDVSKGAEDAMDDIKDDMSTSAPTEQQ